MAKGAIKRGPTTSGSDPDAGVADQEIEAAGGDTDLALEDQQDQPPRIPRNEDQDDERDEQKPADLKFEADPRDAMVKTFRENRKVEGRELTTDAEDDEAEDAAERVEAGEEETGDPEVVIVAGPGSREVTSQPEAKPRKVVDLADDDLVMLKVDGADVEMTYGEMKKRTQIAAASDNRLTETNRLLDEARALVATLKNPNSVAAPANQQRPDGGIGADTRPAPSGQTTADRKARLAKIVDSIQTDVPDKAVEALEGLVSEIRADLAQTNAQVPDIRAEVRSTIQAEESERDARVEIVTAFREVSDTYGDVFTDQRMAKTAFEDTVDNIIGTLRKAGTPDADFKALADDVSARNAKEPDPAKHDTFGLAIIREYTKLTRNPDFKLKPVREIMTSVARDVRTWKTGDVNVPANDKGKRPSAPAGGGNGDGSARQSSAQPTRVVISSSRSERKAGVSVQPRSASMRPDFSAKGATPRKNTSDAIAKLAEARR